MPFKRKFFFARINKKKRNDSKAINSEVNGQDTSTASKKDLHAHLFGETFRVISSDTLRDTVIPSTHDTGHTVIFFQHGARSDGNSGYFTAHGKTAVILANIYREKLGRHPRSGLEFINLNPKLLRRILRSLLLHHRSKIEIWKKNLDTKTSKKSDSKNLNDQTPSVQGWSLSLRASPAVFGDIKDMLFHARDEPQGKIFASDQTLYAAEAASCMSVTISNRRLDCSCTCAELRFALVNQSRQILGVHLDRIYWNANEAKACPLCCQHCGQMQRRQAYRKIGKLLIQHDVRECIVANNKIWSAAVVVGAHGSSDMQATHSTVQYDGVPNEKSRALLRIATDLMGIMNLHRVVMTMLSADQFSSDGIEARNLIRNHVSISNSDGVPRVPTQSSHNENNGKFSCEQEKKSCLQDQLKDPRTMGCICALLRYLRVGISKNDSFIDVNFTSAKSCIGDAPFNSLADNSSINKESASRQKSEQFQMERIVWNSYMHISQSVMQTLSIFEDSTTSVNANNGSLLKASANRKVPKTLYALLSAPCVTALGPSLLIQWLRKPLQSRSAINERLDIVNFFTAHPEVLSDLRAKAALQGIPNLHSICHSFRTKKARLRAMIQIYGFCNHLRHILELLLVYTKGVTTVSEKTQDLNPLVDAPIQTQSQVQQSDKKNSDFEVLDANENPQGESPTSEFKEESSVFTSLSILNSRLVCASDDLTMFEQLVEASIDINEYQKSGRLQIIASLHPKLQELAVEIGRVNADIETERLHVAKQLKLDSVKIKIDSAPIKGIHRGTSVSGSQLAFRITKTFDKNLRTKENKCRFTILSRQKDGIRFVSDTCVRLGKRLRTFNEEYHTIQMQLQEKAIAVAATFVPVITDVAAALGELDVLQSFAYISINSTESYTRPMISDWSGPLSLRGSRHALLEVQPGIECIQNDVLLSRKDGRLQVITGPNMGGKSTFIRQVATCVLLAHIGCNVPCVNASVPLMDGIYARVGSSDNTQGGVSTFMAEMLAAQTILADATSKSLVIIDEIGRGTSVADGCGLAWAIARHMALQIKCYCLFATHFQELTLLSQAVTMNTCVKDADCGNDQSDSMERKIVHNKNMTAHTTPTTITMLYEIQPGICSDSLGLQCAKMAGFPTRVLSEAKRWKDEFKKISEKKEN